MGVIAKILIGLLAAGAMGSAWASLSGYGAKEMKGAAAYQPNVRAGSTGHSRSYHQGGKF